ncbi:PepSY domain-containing protein [Brevundimonas sp. S1H14]|jgi:uncharacterized iron-regulated membrane protein|uniref:PepSY domain-containing protein n=1 Tax=Brevundimonas sp. S1H14 TaxID=3078084 RepID=UPI000380FCFE
MKLLRLSTQLHKWIALLVGLQILFWVGGGLVMTAIPIETVRGEHRVRTAPPQALDLTRVRALDEIVAERRLTPTRAELKSTPRGQAWVLTLPAGAPVILEARTGRPFAPLEADEARRLAATLYRGEARAGAARRLDDASAETGREGPLWRVEFEDRERTRFYVSPDTGEVVTRRSGIWRLYDFFWRLHILDFKTGENFNHPLLIVASGLSLVVVLSGVVLLWIRLERDLIQWRARRGAKPRRARGRLSEP